MPDNLTKILHTCRQVNYQTNVKKLSLKRGHSEYLLKLIYGLVVVLNIKDIMYMKLCQDICQQNIVIRCFNELLITYCVVK